MFHKSQKQIGYTHTMYENDETEMDWIIFRQAEGYVAETLFKESALVHSVEQENDLSTNDPCPIKPGHVRVVAATLDAGIPKNMDWDSMDDIEATWDSAFRCNIEAFDDSLTDAPFWNFCHGLRPLSELQGLWPRSSK